MRWRRFLRIYLFEENGLPHSTHRRRSTLRSFFLSGSEIGKHFAGNRLSILHSVSVDEKRIFLCHISGVECEYTSEDFKCYRGGKNRFNNN